VFRVVVVFPDDVPFPVVVVVTAVVVFPPDVELPVVVVVFPGAGPFLLIFLLKFEDYKKCNHSISIAKNHETTVVIT
jgi:hypothetical protein